jgi:hypothetical protein
MDQESQGLSNSRYYAIDDEVKDFRMSLYNEEREQVEGFLCKYDINKPQDMLGCVDGLGKGLRWGWEVYDGYGTLSTQPGIKHWSGRYVGFFYYLQDENPFNYDVDDEITDKNKTYGEYIPWTPLQYVCAAGNQMMVDYLLENGADPTIKDKTGRDSLAIAQLFRDESYVEWLIEYLEEHGWWRRHFGSKVATMIWQDVWYTYE